MEDQLQLQQPPPPPLQQQQQELPPAVVKVRWKPNDDQLRMLVRLFEEEGDSINKQRIKEIAVDLARCGDCTEANVHNWFHNRKARAKRKQKLMQQNDGGESEVDTDVDSKGKRAKVDHHHHHNHGGGPPPGSRKPVTMNGSMCVSEFVPTEPLPGFPMRQPLRLPSDAVNFSNRVYENSLMLTAHPFQPHPAGMHPSDSFRLPSFQPELVPETHMIEWPRPLALMPTQPGGTEVLDRSSESKTITDDASTESEDISDTRAWNSNSGSSKGKKAWKKKGKGTMIRKPVDRPPSAPAANGRSGRHVSGNNTSSRRSRIREVIKTLKKNGGDSFERDLKALFVEIIKRIGSSKARSILNRLTRHDSDTSSSASLGMDSVSCSSTASLPRQARKASTSSPSECGASKVAEQLTSTGGYRYNPALLEQQRIANVQVEQRRYQQQQQQPGAFAVNQHNNVNNNSINNGLPPKPWEGGRHELTLSTHVVGRSSSTSGEENGVQDEDDDEETDVEREEFRIVWASSSQKPPHNNSALAPGMFCSSSFDNRGAVAESKTERNLKQCSSSQELEGEKTNVTLVNGKPSGTAGTWWNSTLRQTALEHMDVSIPHISLQPEEGMARIRDRMESKFSYVGGSLDDAYMKKQVAKALNFRRHKVMRLIEQGANRPVDVTEEQWDSLIKYYADPKRREKSDKQRAALKALNMNNHLQHQQPQPEPPQPQHHQVHAFNLNMSAGGTSNSLPVEEAEAEEEEEDDDEEEDDESCEEAAQGQL